MLLASGFSIRKIDGNITKNFITLKSLSGETFEIFKNGSPVRRVTFYL